METIFGSEILIALITLTFLEIILGIDNIIFISILAGKLPASQQKRARLTGLALAMITRVALLFSLSLLMKLTEPFFTVIGNAISGKDLILIIGGLFLLAKSTKEIHEKMEGHGEEHQTPKAANTFINVIIQILLLDIVFSLDSVITAVGMANQLWVMIAAVIIAVIFMMFFSKYISDFINTYPTFKMLALSFLMLIGFTLVLEGLDQHVPKGYIYFGMAFSFFVEILNVKSHSRKHA